MRSLILYLSLIEIELLITTKRLFLRQRLRENLKIVLLTQIVNRSISIRHEGHFFFETRFFFK